MPHITDEGFHLARRKSLIFAILIGVISLSVIYVHNNVRHKPNRFLLPLERDISISYDPLIIEPDGAKQKKVKKKSEENIVEAEMNLKAALELQRAGKLDKAFKVFKHSLALSPNHPRILTEYGLFLEKFKNDIVLADGLFFRALTFDSNYARALTERQRTATVVQNIDEERLKRLDEKRDVLSEVDVTSAKMRRATKEAYILQIYHSCGIEGNSMTLAETRSVLETRMAVNGRSVDEHNEILGLDSAMKYVNHSLVRNEHISLDDILQIHKRVLGHVDPIEGGMFRTCSVFVGSHIPPKPSDVQPLMADFVEWLNSEETMEMHPVKLAAIAHYQLVKIHPFVDGNGRTSRLLMNTILMKYGFPPVVIQKQQRLQYYNCLQMANDGDIRPFIRFIADSTERTLDLYLWATSEMPYQVPMLAQSEIVEEESPLTILDDGSNDDLSISGSGEAIRL